jgi:hypothetical protein
MRGIWRRHGLRPHRMQQFKPSNAPDKIAAAVRRGHQVLDSNR